MSQRVRSVIFAAPVALSIAISFALYYIARGTAERAEFRAMIEREGGQVISSRRIGLFVRSPFPGLRQCPLYYEYRAKYGDREGSWFVAASANASAWAWRDTRGEGTLPVERPDAWIDNRTIALGYIWEWVIGAIMLMVIAAILHYGYDLP